MERGMAERALLVSLALVYYVRMDKDHRIMYKEHLDVNLGDIAEALREEVSNLYCSPVVFVICECS